MPSGVVQMANSMKHDDAARISQRPRWLILALLVSAVGLGVSAFSLAAQLGWISTPPAAVACGAPTPGAMRWFGIVAGIPAPWLTSMAFSLALVLCGLALLRPGRSGNVRKYLTAVALVNAAVCLSVGYQLLAVWRASCVPCVTAYGAGMLLLMLCLAASPSAVERLAPGVRRDLARLVQRPAIFLTMLGTGGVLAGLTVSVSRAAGEAGARALRQVNPQAIASLDMSRSTDRAVLKAWHENVGRLEIPASATNGVGGPGTRVLVIKFNDYSCSLCKQTSENYAPVFARLEREYPGAVAITQREFPLDRACNPSTPGRGQTGACDASLLALASRSREHHDSFVQWLYAHPKAPPAEMWATFKKMTGTVPSAQERATLMARLSEDITLGRQLGITLTPTFLVNGIRVNAVSANMFEEILRLEIERSRELSWRQPPQ